MTDTWRKEKLGDISVIRSGSTPSRAKQQKYYTDVGIPWVKTMDLNNGTITHTEEHITDDAIRETSCQVLPKGTVLVAMYGGFNQIGRTGLLGIEAATNQAVSSIQLDKTIAKPEFVLYWLNAHVNDWKRIAASSRRDPNITRDDVCKFQIALPLLDEQQRIVDILATWDYAIEIIKQLIAAKQLRKRGLMQQLLTGKRRFKEFTDSEWTQRRLGDLFLERRETGQIDLPLLSITRNEGIIPREEVERRDTSNEDKSKYLRICKGDIGYNTMRMWQGVSAMSNLEGIVSPAYTICVPLEDVDAHFMEYLFKFSLMINLFLRYSQGLVDDTLSLKFDNFAKIEVTIPALIDEQKRIAQVLDTCDRELALHNRKLALLKKQKQGLMQQLLTGKVRVKI